MTPMCSLLVARGCFSFAGFVTCVRIIGVKDLSPGVLPKRISCYYQHETSREGRKLYYHYLELHSQITLNDVQCKSGRVPGVEGNSLISLAKNLHSAFLLGVSLSSFSSHSLQLDALPTSRGTGL